MTREDQEVIATGKPIRVEQPLTDALGQRRWFDTIKSPIFNERGEVTGTVGIARETTERQQTDEALRVSEERFRSVWEHSIDGMRLTDREGRILTVNEAFCRLVKLPAREADWGSLRRGLPGSTARRRTSKFTGNALRPEPSRPG